MQQEIFAGIDWTLFQNVKDECIEKYELNENQIKKLWSDNAYDKDSIKIIISQTWNFPVLVRGYIVKVFDCFLCFFFFF